MLSERETPSPNITLALSQRRALGTWLIALAIGAIALLPRCIQLADFMTIDEPYHWIGRVRRFGAALATGDWAATNQTGHPGVTTMWLGALGRWLGTFVGLYDGGRAGNSVEYLAMLRLPIAVSNSLMVVLGYLLLRRLLRPTTAALAACLWATSPFLIAHSRLLHLDGLLTSFMTLSVLLLIGGCGTKNAEHGDTAHRSSADCRLLIVSGFCAGLALLTKAPSLVLLPVVGVLLFVMAGGSLRDRLRISAIGYALWLGAALVVVVVGWPAMWVDPLHSIRSVVGEVVSNGGQAEPAGNFFFGHAVADPGWLFYGAVLLWRSTPVMLLGLICLPWALRRYEERRTLLALVFFALCFAAALSIEPKKFDRYLLPAWPALEILAAAGIVALGEQQWARKASRWLPGGAILFMLVTDWWYQPYYLSYYNPLLGGGAVAQRVMLVGLGEGMERVGAWLDARPDLDRGPVLAWIGPTLSPFVSEQVLDLQPQFLEHHGSYAVLYTRSVQRAENPAVQAYVEQTAPLYTVQMHGITYATVYQLPRPFDQPLNATFGDGLHLRGFSQARVGNTLVITPSWDVRADGPGGRFSFVHVLAADGTHVAQVDAPLDEGLFSVWQAGQQFGNPLVLPLPAALPSGSYRVTLGVYDPVTGARLPLTSGAALPPEVDGANTLLLTSVKLGN